MHKTVSKSKSNRSEECNKLLAEPAVSCEFFQKQGKLISHIGGNANLKVHGELRSF